MKANEKDMMWAHNRAGLVSMIDKLKDDTILLQTIVVALMGRLNDNKTTIDIGEECYMVGDVRIDVNLDSETGRLSVSVVDINEKPELGKIPEFYFTESDFTKTLHYTIDGRSELERNIDRFRQQLTGV
jgi:hypothetical protein